MEVLQPHLEFLMDHIFTVIFCAFVIEAAGVPFPSRILLIIAATVAPDVHHLVGLIAVTTLGAVVGDHVPYMGGKLVGPRLLRLYCRITLGSERCVEQAVHYFKRYGAAAVVLSRFSLSVRLFASALSGCGHISYARFVTFDLIGTLLYATFWGIVGYVIGDQAQALFARYGRKLLFVVPLGIVSLLAYRLWRRYRYGAAQPTVVKSEGECAMTERPGL